MNEILSYCGLVCSSCPIYLAGQELDETKRTEMINNIIQMTKQHYGIHYKNEDITPCDGCKSNSGRLFSGCSNCKIRTCAVQKEIENCAYCKDYICQNLAEALRSDPSAKIRLDKIHNNINNNINKN